MGTKINVFHEGKKVTFVDCLFGPNTYEVVGKEILNDNLGLPTGDHTVSLLHTLYCNPSPYGTPEFDCIRQLIRNNGLWVFNRNLWTPDGVYVLQDLLAKGNSELLESSKLKKILENGKENIYGVRFGAGNMVRFAPKETYKFGKHTPDSLSKDGFILASFGEEGARKLGEVFTHFDSSYIFGPKIGELEQSESEQWVSTLYPRFDNGLCFVSNNFNSKYWGCSAFGWCNEVF